MNVTRIKICGITNLRDAKAAAKAGADLLGYVMYPPSKRFVNAAKVRKIVGVIMDTFPNVQHVAVTVNEPFDYLARMADLTAVDVIQLHGQETPETVAGLRRSGVTVIKAIPVSGDQLILDPAEYDADHLLFDTHSAAKHGGTGQQFNLDALSGSISWEQSFIAGGFTPSNIASVLKTVSPYAVDVASGVEKSPGIKDHALVSAFIDTVRRHSNPA